MIIAWDNVADDATLTTDSELATLPASNVQNPHVVKRWHTAAGVKSAYLIFDMATSTACAVAAVLGTNLTATATIQIRASDSDATVTSSLLYDSGSVSAGVVSGYGAIYKSFDSATARYWRIDLADTAVDSNLQVGRVFLGPKWTPTVAQQLPWSVMSLDPSQRTRTKGGQVHVDELPQMRIVQFTLDYMTEAEMFGNAFALARANGLARDVLAVSEPDGSYLSQQAIFGLLQASEPLVNERLSLWRQKFTIEERL
jgi:hypothetical protein